MSKFWRCHIPMSFGLVTYTPGTEWVNSAVSLLYEGRIVGRATNAIKKSMHSDLSPSSDLIIQMNKLL